MPFMKQNACMGAGRRGQVSLARGNKTIWLNFGDSARAASYFARKIQQGLPDVQLKSFETDVEFLRRLQATAVPELFAPGFPNRPIISSDPYPNHFGIRPNQFQQLLHSITKAQPRMLD